MEKSEKYCHHEADVSCRELSKALSSGKTLLTGEINTWRFKCKKCGAYLKYTYPFAKDLHQLSYRLCCLAGAAVMIPCVILLIALSNNGALDGLPAAAAAAIAAGVLALSALAMYGAWMALISGIRRGKIGRFTEVSYDSWMRLTAIEESMASPERQRENKVRRVTAAALLGLLIVVTVLAALLNK